MVVSLLKKFKNIIIAIFLCISVFSVGMSNVNVHALKTDEIVREMQKMKFFQDYFRRSFIEKILDKYSISCDYFNANKHKCGLFLDKRACESFKYFLIFRSLCDVYREYGIASPEGLLKDLDNFIDSLGTLVFKRSPEEKLWDDTYIPEFYRYQIFSWQLFQ